VFGFLELAGESGRILLDLEGNAHPDMAGSLIRFRNPDPQPGSLENFAMEQTGVAGDITASRRVKNLLVPAKAFLVMRRNRPGSVGNAANPNPRRSRLKKSPHRKTGLRK